MNPSQGGVEPLSVRSHRTRYGNESGAVAVVNVVAIAVVVVATLMSFALLARTTSAANRIEVKAQRIAKTGQGINTATDSVIQLNRTNETAASILTTATPLEPKLAEIVRLAVSVNGLATSIDGTAKTSNGTGGKINGTAGTINKTAKEINATAGAIQASAVSIDGTAGTINKTAKDINAQAAAILDVGKRIDADVASINKLIDSTLGIVTAVKGDTGNILLQANDADRLAKCINDRIPPGNANACS
jgi:methyl-accepting chemotaxis protein